jgi:hypothetical protein
MPPLRIFNLWFEIQSSTRFRAIPLVSFLKDRRLREKTKEWYSRIHEGETKTGKCWGG